MIDMDELFIQNAFIYLRKLCPHGEQKDILAIQSKFIKKFHISVTDFNLVLSEFEKRLWIIKDENTLTIDVLSNQSRKQIFNFIEKNPGIHLNAIKTILGFGTNQLIWHLNILIKYHLIKTHKIGSFEVFSDIATNKDIVFIGFILYRPSIQQIVKYLLNNPNGLTTNDLIMKTNLPKTTIYFQIKKLKEFNILIVHKKKGQQFYQINPKFEEIIGERVSIQ